MLIRRRFRIWISKEFLPVNEVRRAYYHKWEERIRKFNMPRQLTTTKTSHEEKKLTFFQSLSWLDYSNSLTLSNASEILWNWISINHIQVQKRKNILSLLVYVLHETCEIRHFHVVVVQGRQRNICKKAWCTCKVVVLPCQAIAFFTFSSPLHLEFPNIYDTLWSVRNRIF